MKYREEIGQSIANAMSRDPMILTMGEGVTDPKGIFGTTKPANDAFPDRVIETPLSENMLTGACIGMALEGWKPIFVHARCDFLMVAMEHMVNSAAKWRYLHKGRSFSMVVRCLVGRGWGQGPNHSQAMHATFAHIPGLRVLYPVIPQNVSHWFDVALNCGAPTIILEPRRVYELESLEFPQWEQPDLYIATFGDVVIDAAHAARELESNGIKAQVFPIEDVTTMNLPKGNVPTMVVDTGHLFCGAAAEAIAQLAESGNTRIKRVGPPFIPLPTSFPLEQEWYPGVNDLLCAAADLLDLHEDFRVTVTESEDAFKGPF
jgi:pyruvate dehydrogenase E1 component beta subunit